MLSFAGLLFVSTVYAGASVTSSPCTTMPSSFLSDLVKGEPSAQGTLWQMVKECPQQVQNLGNSSMERLVVKGNLANWQKNLEDVIRRDYQDRSLDQQESDFESLAKILGKGPNDAKVRDLIKQSKDSSAREKACTAKDNRDDSLGKARNQGEVGWCYAFTAADLISHKLKKRVSATDIAFGFNQKDPTILGEKLKKAMEAGELLKKNRFTLETSSDGGLTTEAINYQTAKGVCLEKDLPSDETTMSSLKTSLDELDRLKYQMEKDPQMCQFGAYKASFARFPALPLRDILQTAYETDYSQVMVKLADKNCEGKRVSMKGIEAIEVVVRNEKTAQEALKMVDSALDNKSIAGIGYDMKVLGDEEAESQSHASSIVGRRYNAQTKQCEYLLRNSWGDKFDDSSPLENDKGYYWVPRSNLKRVLSDVTVIK